MEQLKYKAPSLAIKYGSRNIRYSILTINITKTAHFLFNVRLLYAYVGHCYRISFTNLYQTKNTYQTTDVQCVCVLIRCAQIHKVQLSHRQIMQKEIHINPKCWLFLSHFPLFPRDCFFSVFGGFRFFYCFVLNSVYDTLPIIASCSVIHN